MGTGSRVNPCARAGFDLLETDAVIDRRSLRV
jgi:hypothetical protein